MRVGWLTDEPSYIGGAELTQTEFRAAAPDGVQIIDCPIGNIDPDCDRYVIHNCVTYAADELEPLLERSTTKYWHDVGPHLSPRVREILNDDRIMPVCCSPVQADHMGIEDPELIPPPVDLSRFEQAAERVNGNGRKGIVSVGAWRNYGKAPHKAAEWAQGRLDFFGGGTLAPPGSHEVPYELMPDLLAGYRTFVFLPTVIEPFGRLIAEAWASGCEIVTNDLVGAKWWVTERPEAITTAAEDFWDVVLG